MAAKKRVPWNKGLPKEQQVAVFCDGNYWHSKEFDNGKVWKKDRNQDKVLKESGWTVLRFWGSEIRSDVSGCVDKILISLEED